MVEDQNKPLDLGVLDLTSDDLSSLAGLSDKLDALASGSIIENMLDGGRDPREMMAQLDSKLSTAEVSAVQDYVAESDNLIALHEEIKSCDKVLESIEGLLGQYATNLATISLDIRTLQERSQAMNIKLRNRRALQTGLSEFVERVAILPSLIHTIMEAPTTSDEFSRGIEQLSAKLLFVANDNAIRRSAAFRDIAPELERLRLVAVKRCRELLLDNIYGLRKPRAHVQAKQAALLRHESAASFLKSHGGDIYSEVRTAYAEKVSGKLLDIFKSYWAAMERVEDTVVTAENVLGAPEGLMGSASGGVAAMFSTMLGSFGSGAGGGGSNSGGNSSGGVGGFTSVSSNNPKLIEPHYATVSARRRAGDPEWCFALGDRGAVLAAIDAPPLILHEAEAEGRKFPFEALFRSLSKLLMDTAAHEYLFCCDFWGDDGKSVYKSSFSPVTSFVQASLSAAIHDLYDPVALLLIIRITREHSLTLARRGIPALDDHFDALNLQFWPRLKSLLDTQLDSLKTVTPESTALELVPTKVHVVTRRYAALTASVLSLHVDFLDGPLSGNIERMRYAVMNLLLTLSRGFSQRGRGTVFLIINFSHVVSVLKAAAAKPLPSPPPLAVNYEYASTAAKGRSRIDNTSTTTTTTTHISNGNTSSHQDGDRPMYSNGLGPIGDDVMSAFEESLSRATSLYVDARLTAGAPQLLTFVKRGEAAAAQSPEGEILAGFGPSEAAPVAKDFSGRWERIVGVLNREIGQDFGNTVAGRAVQQAAFTQILLNWSRFLDLVKRQGPEGVQIAQSAVSMPSIMYALKQHRLG